MRYALRTLRNVGLKWKPGIFWPFFHLLRLQEFSARPSAPFVCQKFSWNMLCRTAVHQRFDAWVTLQDNGHSMFLAPFCLLLVSNRRCWELLMAGIIENRSWLLDDTGLQSQPCLVLESWISGALLNICLRFISRLHCSAVHCIPASKDYLG